MRICDLVLNPGPTDIEYHSTSIFGINEKYDNNKDNLSPTGIWSGHVSDANETRYSCTSVIRSTHLLVKLQWAHKTNPSKNELIICYKTLSSRLMSNQNIIPVKNKTKIDLLGFSFHKIYVARIFISSFFPFLSIICACNVFSQ